MKRQRIQLIVLAVLLLVVIGGYFLLRQVDFSEQEPEAVSVLKLEGNQEIVKIAYDGIANWQFEKAEGNWSDREAPMKQLSQTQVQALSEYLAHMEAKEVIENPEDLAVYGLKEPAGTVEIGLADGGSRTLYIGSQNDMTQDYYVKTEGADTVYTVNSYEAEAFIKEESAFLEPETTSDNAVSDNSVSVEED